MDHYKITATDLLDVTRENDPRSPATTVAEMEDEMIAEKDLVRALVRALTDAGMRQRIPARQADARWFDVVERVVRPHIPAGTCQWLAIPESGETRAAYARRVVRTAAGRSSWAGGLVGVGEATGAYPDRAAVESAAKLARR